MNILKDQAAIIGITGAMRLNISYFSLMSFLMGWNLRKKSKEVGEFKVSLEGIPMGKVPKIKISNKKEFAS